MSEQGNNAHTGEQPNVMDLPPITAERVAPGVFVARNDRGGEVRIGMPGAPDSLTPGELLQLAVAGCQGLASESAVVSRLGENYAASVTNEAVYRMAPEERLTDLRTTYRIDMSTLSDEERAALAAHVKRVVDQICVVGHTVQQGAPTALKVEHLEAQ